MQTTNPHAALLASPGIGHLTPVLELAKTLVTHHGFHVTLFVVTMDASSTVQTQLIESPIHPNLHIVVLPVNISDLPTISSDVVQNIFSMMHHSLPLLRSEISKLKIKPVILIIDLFGVEAYSIADEFQMLKFVFNTSTAWFLAVTIYSPVADEKLINEHVAGKKPLMIPGCKTLRFEDTLDAYSDPNNPSVAGFLGWGSVLAKADGFLVNTWQDLESPTFKALNDKNVLGRYLNGPVYPIGPLARVNGSSSNGENSNEIIKWLDKQPGKSVIYVSFGSGGTLSGNQITELAWGLELSQQRFVWVVRPPIENNVSGSFFTADKGNNGNDTSSFLPDGFLYRTREVGLVVPMWAPQSDILAHESVGGFLSHCGWNSTLEGIMNGVPMICWPLYSEQYMNASMLNEDIMIGLRSKTCSNNNNDVVERDDIKTMVHTLIATEKGDQMRKIVNKVKLEGKEAVKNVGGSSFKSLSIIADECKKRMSIISEDKSKGA